MKLVHVADIHLGAKLGFLGEKAPKQRDNIALTFSSAVNKAIEINADIFLIAGDLFDSNDPASKTLIFAINQIKKLLQAKIYVALIPGNHDYLSGDSVYKYTEWNVLKMSPYFHLFENEQITGWQIADLDAVIYGAAVTKKRSSSSQLDSFKSEAAKYQIGIFHGSVDLLGTAANYPLPVAKLRQLPLDYIALGDWHSTLEVSKQDPVCWYSGSPEIIASDQSGAGKMLLADINGGKTSVQQVQLSGILLKNLEYDINGSRSNFDIISKVLHGLNDPGTTILNLKLTGIRSLEFMLDAEVILAELRNKCFYANLNNATTLQLTEEQISNYSKHFLIANYIEYINQVKKDDPEKTKIADLALQEGLSLLLNREETDADN